MAKATGKKAVSKVAAAAIDENEVLTNPVREDFADRNEFSIASGEFQSDLSDMLIKREGEIQKLLRDLNQYKQYDGSKGVERTVVNKATAKGLKTEQFAQVERYVEAINAGGEPIAYFALRELGYLA